MPDLRLQLEQGALDGCWHMLAVEGVDADPNAVLQNVLQGVLLPLLLLLVLRNRPLHASVHTQRACGTRELQGAGRVASGEACPGLLHATSGWRIILPACTSATSDGTASRKAWH
jgi:hypothetical protein